MKFRVTQSNSSVEAWLITGATALLFLAVPLNCVAQQEKPLAKKPANAETKAQAEKPKTSFTVRVSKQQPRALTLKAEDSALTEVAAEISSRLKVPVVLSELMRKQRITMDFEGLPVESALSLLAPQVYIDYELGGDAAALPKPLSIYLYGYNEKAPPLNATVIGNAETLMMEGDTEEVVDSEKPPAKDEKPLQIRYEKQLVSIQSKKQPLTVVLAQLANTLGIPFELRYESREIVDTSFANFRIEDAIRRLSPNVRLYFRMDVQRSESTPLRLVLVAPANS